MTMTRVLLPHIDDATGDVLDAEDRPLALRSEVLALNPVSGTYFEFSQNSPLLEWVINHTIGRKPIVVLLNSDNEIVLADIEYPNNAQVAVTFAQPTTGKAILL